MSVDIQFIGAAGTVTGSKYLIVYDSKKILLDCGLFQGLKSLREQNWDGLPFDAAELHAVILTHAHIDHSGYIPRLIKKGFRGKIYCTEASRDLCRLLLPDAGHLSEEEAAFLNKHHRSKHSPALPLFTVKEAEKSLEYFETLPFHQSKELFPGFAFEFRYAGHILGAASVRIWTGKSKILFTGDVGRLQDPIFYPPEIVPDIDYLITESTYGNRLHDPTDPATELEQIVNETYGRKGVLVIPAFAVGRAQSLMYYLWQLRLQNRIPKLPIYLNSPMATNVTDLWAKHSELHRLSAKECGEVCGMVQYVNSEEESKSLNLRHGPMIIISASGMLTGGRVLHHLKTFAPDPKSTILLAGYQAAGTRGEALEHGAREIKIYGEYVPVHAQVRTLHNLSAHADYREIIQWLSDSKIHPKKIFITHGEPAAADELRRRLEENFHCDCLVPRAEQKVHLE